jgi:hypothetical protein
VNELRELRLCDEKLLRRVSLVDRRAREAVSLKTHAFAPSVRDGVSTKPSGGSYTNRDERDDARRCRSAPTADLAADTRKLQGFCSRQVGSGHDAPRRAIIACAMQHGPTSREASMLGVRGAFAGMNEAMLLPRDP